MPVDLDYIAMGKRVRTKRKVKMLTQEQVSIAVGISLSFYGHIERGTRKASAETLVRLAAVLNTTTSYLVDDISNNPEDSPCDCHVLYCGEIIAELRESINRLEQCFKNE